MAMHGGMQGGAAEEDHANIHIEKFDKIGM